MTHGDTGRAAAGKGGRDAGTTPTSALTRAAAAAAAARSSLSPASRQAGSAPVLTTCL